MSPHCCLKTPRKITRIKTRNLKNHCFKQLWVIHDLRSLLANQTTILNSAEISGKERPAKHCNNSSLGVEWMTTGAKVHRERKYGQPRKEF
jgi:hypothetical protein